MHIDSTDAFLDIYLPGPRDVGYSRRPCTSASQPRQKLDLPPAVKQGLLCGRRRCR